MTIPRYRAMLTEWEFNPPQHFLVRGIAQALGLTLTQRPGRGEQQDVYWDESYYKDTKKTPHSKDAFNSLAKDFVAAGGKVIG